MSLPNICRRSLVMDLEAKHAPTPIQGKSHFNFNSFQNERISDCWAIMRNFTIPSELRPQPFYFLTTTPAPFRSGSHKLLSPPSTMTFVSCFKVSKACITKETCLDPWKLQPYSLYSELFDRPRRWLLRHPSRRANFSFTCKRFGTFC